MIEYYREPGQQERYEIVDEVFDDLALAWRAWTMCEAVEWRHLPYPGGLLDQPEALWADMQKIGRIAAVIKEQVKK